MVKHLRVGWLVFQNRLNTIFEHRTDLLLWLTSGFISLLFTLSVWKAFRPQEVFQNLWQFYVIAGIISGLISERFYHRMSQNIHRGGLSFFLLQPFPYLSRTIFDIIASGSINLIITLITLYLISWQFGTQLQLSLSLSQVILALPLLFIGWSISVLISFLLGCIAFVWIRPDSLYLVFDILLPFLIGAQLPLWMLPQNYQWLIKFLPTRWVVSAPTEVILSQTEPYLSVFISGLVWLIILIGVSRYIWNRVLYLYEAVGG